MTNYRKWHGVMQEREKEREKLNFTSSQLLLLCNIIMCLLIRKEFTLYDNQNKNFVFLSLTQLIDYPIHLNVPIY